MEDVGTAPVSVHQRSRDILCVHSNKRSVHFLLGSKARSTRRSCRLSWAHEKLLLTINDMLGCHN